MKKILIFSLAYSPFIGGAELAVKQITGRIGSDGIRFDMITLRFDSDLPKFEKIGNINVYRIGLSKKHPSAEDLVKFPMYFTKVFYPLFAFFQAIKMHRQNKYDALWPIMSYAGFPALFFKLFYKRNIPFILTLQEGDSISHITKRWRIRAVYPFFKMVFAKADFVQAISTYLGGWARAMGFKGPLEIIPNGVDIKRFAREYPEKELSELKNKLGKKADDKYLITTSRLVKKNAINDVIKSLKYLPETVKFIVLGSGPDLDMLQKSAKDESVADRVIFLGMVEHQEIPKYLKISDIFVRPSLSEGMGNSFIEAMAAGLPVVATQAGGIADFLFDRERNPDKDPTGWAVGARDPRGISEQIKKITDNPEKTEKTVANAKKLAFEKYDWDLIAKDMREKVFSKILTKQA